MTKKSVSFADKFLSNISDLQTAALRYERANSVHDRTICTISMLRAAASVLGMADKMSQIADPLTAVMSIEPKKKTA